MTDSTSLAGFSLSVSHSSLESVSPVRWGCCWRATVRMPATFGGGTTPGFSRGHSTVQPGMNAAKPRPGLMKKSVDNGVKPLIRSRRLNARRVGIHDRHAGAGSGRRPEGDRATRRHPGKSCHTPRRNGEDTRAKGGCETERSDGAFSTVRPVASLGWNISQAKKWRVT
jgi:hypothetical protein